MSEETVNHHSELLKLCMDAKRTGNESKASTVQIISSYLFLCSSYVDDGVNNILLTTLPTQIS